MGRREFAQLTVTSCLVAFFGMVCGMSKYRSLIPNGDKIPHPCDRSQLWAALGHEAAEGGGPRNQFGKDFGGNNHSWTKQLCLLDSDGDGKTNGAELGDPNCTWEVGATPAVTDSAQLSHPGVCEPINSTACAGKISFLTCMANISTQPKNMTVAVNVTTGEIASNVTIVIKSVQANSTLPQAKAGGGGASQTVALSIVSVDAHRHFSTFLSLATIALLSTGFLQHLTRC